MVLTSFLETRVLLNFEPTLFGLHVASNLKRGGLYHYNALQRTRGDAPKPQEYIPDREPSDTGTELIKAARIKQLVRMRLKREPLFCEPRVSE